MIDVDLFLRPVSSPVPYSPPESTPFDMKPLWDRIKNVSRPESKAIIKAILAGEPLAEVGARDDTINKAMGILVFSLPPETPAEVILEMARPSIISLPGEPPPGASDWMGVAAEKIARAQERREEKDAKDEAIRSGLQEHLRLESAAVPTPLANTPEEKSDVTGPYSEGDLEVWCKDQGCVTLEEFSRRWIIQKGKAYYVFFNGQYHAPISKDDLEVSLPRDLSRAPIRLTRSNAEGEERPARPSEILRDHASVARTIRASLVLQRSYYDPATQTFNEAVRPRRKITPRFHQEIDIWIRLLGGSYAEKLLDWTAAVARQDRQACAIYFHGGPGVGKSLYANGLSRIWTTGGPSELDRVLDGFNEALVNCPLIFADEALPQKKNATAEIRRILGSTSRNLNRKFQPVCDLEGSVRLILAGNNDRLLDTSEDLSILDQSAVAGRFLYVQPDSAAADYLISLGGPPVIGKWIDDDLIAEHAMWLHDNRPIKEGSRFLVEGESTAFHDHLAIGSGISGSVCEWIVKSLDDPAQQQTGKFMFGHGEVWISTLALSAEFDWMRRVPSIKVPSTTKIGRALSNISTGAIRVLVEDKQITFHRIESRILLAWAERSRVGDVATLEKRIGAANPTIANALARRGDA